MKCSLCLANRRKASVQPGSEISGTTPPLARARGSPGMTCNRPEDSASSLDAQHIAGSSDGTLLLVALEMYARFDVSVE